jgi:hypothetical protein
VCARLPAIHADVVFDSEGRKSDKQNVGLAVEGCNEKRCPMQVQMQGCGTKPLEGWVRVANKLLNKRFD